MFIKDVCVENVLKIADIASNAWIYTGATLALC